MEQVRKVDSLKCAIAFIAICFILGGCNKDSSKSTEKPYLNEEKIFQVLLPERTNINFRNDLIEDAKRNYFTYPYIYMGGGVAVGDLNNDNLPDIYFTGNMVPNKLYLNKGGLNFLDITKSAGVSGDDSWITGVTMADVNNDGYLDIYVCRSGLYPTRNNLLYINNGDLTFDEKAAQYGLDDNGYSIQASFFDYDKDGDLDMYLVNHPISFFASNRQKDQYRSNPPIDFTDKLYQNIGGNKFVDVTLKAGMQRVYAYGLNAVISDLNNDDWPDIYVSNDYTEPDFLYMNNGDGTFTDRIKKATKHIPNFSMGSDLADFNNDGLIDIVALDMLAEDNERKKTNMSGMATEQFWNLVKQGYHYQYMHNTLQMNNGNGTFSEIAQLAGISATDWSWGALMMDLNNDGWKDLYITNGHKRDVNNNDFNRALNKKRKQKPTATDLFKDAQRMPSKKINNYAFKNNGDLTFKKTTDQWGLSHHGFSTGSAYADLDLDGDLEMIINNIDTVSMVYENLSNRKMDHNYIKFKLSGTDDNQFGLGTKINLKYGNQIQTQELTLTRGFQSSVEPILHFGLGSIETIDEVVVQWPNNKKQILKNVKVNQLMVLEQSKAQFIETTPLALTQLFSEATNELEIKYNHTENEYNDFDSEILLPHKMSNFGPCIAVGDVNGDALEDFFVGSASGLKGGRLFMQNNNGTFRMSKSQPWDAHAIREDMGAVFFDVDNDSDMDLYVVSGGNEFSPNAIELQDRLYMNDGKGHFTFSNSLPVLRSSGSHVIPSDFDSDGDIDLFVGGRLVPGKYPYPASSYLLENKNGKLVNATLKIAPELLDIGMVTDGVWSDFDTDGDLDLIITGEWMPITIFQNNDGYFSNITNKLGLSNTTGWWFSIEAADIDRDGDDDYIVGNLGLNYKYKATEEEPFHVYCANFDGHGNQDIVLGYYNFGEVYPVRGRECTSQQMPVVKYKYPNYQSFAKASLIDVYSKKALEMALHYEAKNFASSYMENLGKGNFEVQSLPIKAQLSSINGIIIKDFDADQNLDIIIAGNLYASEVETTRNDASIGLYMKGDGMGNFQPINVQESGFFTPNNVKDLKLINTINGTVILVANNNDKLQAIKVVSKREKVSQKK